MAITCCKDCKPPKRTPTCKFDGTCSKYQEAKAIHDAQKEADRKKHDIAEGITSQRAAAIRRIVRKQRSGHTYKAKSIK